ncbi:MAG: reactive intermediate/imine deaminase [Anaerolineales bacterium]|nr:MAG: reactive intermediate/imine deaminase [Anaerolineales bacterium]
MSSRGRKVVIAEGAPKAIGPYSVAIRTENLVFASGSLGVDPATGEFAAGGVEGQTRQALKNLGEVLKAGGSSLEQVVKTTVFMQDMSEFALMNAVYAEFFPNEPPARSTVEVTALPKAAAVEIEVIALVD